MSTKSFSIKFPEFSGNANPKVLITKTIRTITGWGLKQTVDFVNAGEGSTVQTITVGYTIDRYEENVQTLREAGCIVDFLEEPKTATNFLEDAVILLMNEGKYNSAKKVLEVLTSI